MISNFFKNYFSTAKDLMGAVPIESSEMDAAINTWKSLEQGRPYWLGEDADYKTVRFSNTIARQLALLITENIDIKIEPAYRDTEFAKRLQDELDACFTSRAFEVMQKMITYGGVMAKWNGEGIDFLTPDRFYVTSFDGRKNITGCVFASSVAVNGKFYTRLEWHRYEGKTYIVSNQALISDRADIQGRVVPLSETPWKDLAPEARFENMEKPLFAYLKNPFSNTIDPDSPLGASTFAECMSELRWLDIAMSNLGVEAEQSKSVLFVDYSALTFAKNNSIVLPRFVKTLGSTGIAQDSSITQWQPQLQVKDRIEGINFYLNIIAIKCGFDSGYFVFNGQTISLATATQVESTERKTIATVMSYRSLLDRPKSNGEGRIGFVHDIAYILASMSVLNGTVAPEEHKNYSIYCDFADMTENEEEDKNFDYQLASTGFMSKEEFLVRHLGVTRVDARRMVEDAQKEAERTMMSEAEVQFAISDMNADLTPQSSSQGKVKSSDNRLNSKDDHSSGNSLFNQSPESRKMDKRQTESNGVGH